MNDTNQIAISTDAPEPRVSVLECGVRAPLSNGPEPLAPAATLCPPNPAAVPRLTPSPGGNSQPPFAPLPVPSAVILYQMTNAPLTITSTTTNSIWGAGQGSIVLPPNVLQLGSLIRVHFVGAMSNTTTLTFTNQFLLNGAAFLVQQTSYNSSIKWPCRSHGDGWYAKVTKTGTAGTIAVVMATEIPNGTLLWQQTNSYPINTTVANTFDATMAWSGAGNTVYVYDSTLELLSPP